ncbi:Type 1 glutamine amidotransferase-like domain-containing protein [Radiobacillus sp. PE A8.2]|uniref:Type 1 glutamine amidotransferase-like domain-containing protein n=1 Tax=Radiobacillus sp. PE A8.2 TaxID=3380349 RepID=UPI00388EFD54
MENNHLFLLGGNPSQPEAMQAFVKQAGGNKAKIALLLVYRPGWEAYLPRYTKLWIENGVDPDNISVIIPEPDGYLSMEKAVKTLRNATGIFIGGGHTKTYHFYYTNEILKSMITSQYTNGVPIAGCSAGALILPTQVLLSPSDTDNGKAWLGEGIGLVDNVLISVHYSKWNDAANLELGLLSHDVPIGYGIDDDATLVVKDGKEFSYLGKERVHKVINKGS